MNIRLVGVAAIALAVAACGTEQQERTTGGAAAGAATGAGIGALGGPVGALAGAAIGGGAGAVTGATTSPSDVNLGSPPWSNPEARVPGLDENRSRVSSSGSARAQRGSSSIRQAQRELNQRGYDVGAVDGIWGPRTSSALANFQRDNNLEPSGRLDGQTRQALNLSRGDESATGGGRNGAYMGGGAVGTGDGMTGPATDGTGSGGTMENRPMNGTGSTGPGGTSGVGSGNQPGVGGTTQTR